jgi:alpha-L-fucosidase
MLIDIVAKNGCMLLNILQKPDGSIDAESRYLLEELAGWFPVCGEAIHGTRPWRQYGEGDSRVVIEGFKEEKATWNNSDFRFTTRGQTLYAFMLKAPENRIAVLKSLGETDRVLSVRLLGAGECEFRQAFGVLTVKLPSALPTSYTNALAIQLA